MAIGLEQTVLSLGDLHRSRTLLIVIRHTVDPRAHGIAPHQFGIIRLQQFGGRTHIRHPRIEPQVVVIRIENCRHAVVDGESQPDWCRTFTLVAILGQSTLSFVVNKLREWLAKRPFERILSEESIRSNGA